MSKAPYVYRTDHHGFERVLLFKTSKLAQQQFIIDVIEHIENEIDEEDYSCDFLELKRLQQDHGELKSRFELAQKVYTNESDEDTFFDLFGPTKVRSKVLQT